MFDSKWETERVWSSWLTHNTCTVDITLLTANVGGGAHAPFEADNVELVTVVVDEV